MKTCCSIFLFLLTFTCFAQDSVRIFPTHWWTGMKNRNLQLLLYGNVGSLAGNAAIKIKKVTTLSNPHYTAVDVEIATNAQPGLYKLNDRISFQLKPRVIRK